MLRFGIKCLVFTCSFLILASLSTAQTNPKFIVEEATIETIHAAMKSGDLTARQLVEMYLRRIDAYDKKGPALNSVIMINPKAMDTARDLDAKLKESGIVGPLHGIPVLLKDNIGAKDMPMTGGSLSLKDFTPPDDAPIVKKLKEAGAIILAKVNLHEFAMGSETISSILGQTLNPYDLTRNPAGSSGGTAVGIAANFGAIGIGTDTINSARSPASACNLVSVKPTLGLISRTGIIPVSLTLDMAGPITRTVADMAILLRAIAGYDPADPETAWNVGNIPKSYTAFLDRTGLKGSRIGVLKSFFGTGQEHQEVNTVIEKAIDIMKSEGATIVPIDESIDPDQATKTAMAIITYELKAQLNEYLESMGPSVPVKSLEEIIASGKYHKNIEGTMKFLQTASIEDPKYKESLVERMKWQQTLIKTMADHMLDAIVYPHQRTLVSKIGKGQTGNNGSLASLTGFPAIVVPAGFSTATDTAPLGVPVGIEIAGRPWCESILIKLAYSFEQASKFRHSPTSTPPLASR